MSSSNTGKSERSRCASSAGSVVVAIEAIVASSSAPPVRAAAAKPTPSGMCPPKAGSPRPGSASADSGLAGLIGRMRLPVPRGQLRDLALALDRRRDRLEDLAQPEQAHALAGLLEELELQLRGQLETGRE